MRLLACLVSLLLATPALAAPPLTGDAAFGDWRADAPGVARHIRPQDVPGQGATQPSSAHVRVVPKPADVLPKVPSGFAIAPLATGIGGARTLRFAPNGDLFVAQSADGTVAALRLAPDGASVVERKTFATGVDGAFGLAFYPPGPDPKWLYVAGTTTIVRFPYKAGDLVASRKPETIVRGLPDGGHSTRDIVFSRDGSRMFVSVGSESNVAEDMGRRPSSLAAFEKTRATGAAWGSEDFRATVLVFDPQGKHRRILATGLRNCVAMALAPASDRLWCAVNERDMLGDDLPPDYATEVRDGAFYGWPWFYIGAHADKRAGLRPDLADKVRVPDVLIQAHSAPLGIAFYESDRFPADYRGDAFVALHGSWNRGKRTGYKIVRLRFADGAPTGVYEDFVTGFVLDDKTVFGRPVSVAVAPDGALLFSEDGNGVIWRVTYAGAR